MRVSWLLGAVVALGLSTAGNAASITILPTGDRGPPAGYVPDATFDSVPAQAYGSTSPSGSFVQGGVAFSGTGVVMNNGGQGSLGLYASPLGDTTNYMAVLGGGSEEIAYSSFNTSFGLYWGSVDTYNSLAFYSGSVLVATITGADLPLSANGGQTDYASNAYVWITALPQFDRVFAASSSNAFEFDNIVAGSATTSFSAAVPEPSTWAMLLFGFVGLGYAAFRRSKTPISAVA
ncbi:MAG: PEP-CTERM sorting domain-containing protein [Roseiarcus sp.]|jgi:PEP-CTERM motif